MGRARLPSALSHERADALHRRVVLGGPRYTFRDACFDYWRRTDLPSDAIYIDLKLVEFYCLPLISWFDVKRMGPAHLEVLEWLLMHDRKLDPMTLRRTMLATERIVDHARFLATPYDVA